MTPIPDIREMVELAKAVRIDVLNMCEQTGTGHLGSAYSVTDILAVLYSGILRGRPADPERDRLILSKGHSCAALYAVLHRKGILPEDVFETFARNGTRIGHHPHFEPAIGLEANMGSLGHGLPIAAGLAFAARKQKSDARVFVIQSDGETNEGSVWEAALFAAHHKLNRLCMTLDANKIQAMGFTKDILFPTDHATRWQAFGWEVIEVDGHDHRALWDAHSRLGASPKPLAVIAHTLKGKGVSFMENQLLWHYRCPKGDDYRAALQELSGSPAL
ncbi:MAG: transketolase [Lentisphaerae bacterium]|nr:transketolase [Lentisphaerota bacterium]